MANWQIKAALALMLTALGLGCAVAAPPPPPHQVAVSLAAAEAAAVPAKTLTVVVRERMAPGWHTYWINPGDSGEPTSIEWELPEGAKAGPILWPLPHVIMVGPLAEYGYDGEAPLLAEVQVPAQAAGSFRIGAKVSYLVCKDICIPEETHVELALPVAAEAGRSADADGIEAARAALAKPLPGSAAYAVNPAKGVLRLSATVAPELLAGVTEAHFYPLNGGQVSGPADQAHQIAGGALTLDIRQDAAKETPAQLDGVLVLTGGGGARAGYTVQAARGPDSGEAGGLFDRAAGAGQARPGAASEGVSDSMAVAVLFAFLGGLILNLMPCVFPVLAIKALAFSTGGNEGHREQGFAYLGGVLVSFAVLAGLIAILREGLGTAAAQAAMVALGMDNRFQVGGGGALWGFQFHSPAFVLALALLFFLMALSLSGVVVFGAGFMSAGDSLSRKPGNAGYFFTGVLAAVAATPCTAPFMGAALGYAMTQSILVLFLVMLALGAGFAAPVVALSFSPRMQNILPKPGPWMETLKEVLAFPLYAASAWLVWVLSIQTGSDGVMAAAIGVVGVGFAAWLAAKTANASLPLKLIAPAVGTVTVAVGLLFAVTSETINTASGAESSVLKEEPFTQARLDELRAKGRPVFVNLTAAWCITCKVNERVALRSAEVARAFRAAGIAYLKGDWTRANPEISALLEQFGRAGVPLYLFYPGHGAAPHVLPQLLTSGLVLKEIAP